MNSGKLVRRGNSESDMFTVIIIITATTVVYTLLLSKSVVAHIDFWVYNKIWPLTIFYVSTLYVALYYGKTNNSTRLILLSLMLVLVHVITPFIKYGYRLYDPYDSLDHLVFAKWILEKGYVPQNGEVYYSRDYGYNPVAGLLASITSLISSIDLELVITILLFIFISLKFLGLIIVTDSHSSDIKNDLISYGLSCIVISLTYLPEWWGSPAFAYSYAGFSTLMFIRLLRKKTSLGTNLVLLSIVFLYVIFANIVAPLYVLYLIVVIILSYMMLSKRRTQGFPRETVYVLIAYSIIYVVILLFFNIIAQGYLAMFYKKLVEGETLPTELSVYQERAPSIERVLRVLLGTYGKLVLIPVLQGVLPFFVYLQYKLSRKGLNNRETISDNKQIFMAMANILSLPLIIITYMVFFNRLEALSRYVSISDGLVVVMLLNSVIELKITSRKIAENVKFKSAVFVSGLIIANLLLLSNYGFPYILPQNVAYGEETFVSGVRVYSITPWGYSSAMFINEFIQDKNFITYVSYFFPRGYIDLSWVKFIKVYDTYFNVMDKSTLGDQVARICSTDKSLVPVATSYIYVPISSYYLEAPFSIATRICNSLANLVYSNSGVLIYVK